MKKKIAWWLPVALVVCLLAAGCSTDDTQTESSHVHKFGEWVIVTQPTCTETGMRERSCACGEIERETLDARHSLVGDKCKRCGREASKGLEFALNDDGNSYSVIGSGSCQDKDILIPAEHEGKPVTGVTGEARVGRDGFSSCKSLTSITIPDSVTNIGGYAFKNCKSLTSIAIPDGVTSIGEKAFIYCESLMSITIPDGVTSIGEKAFYNCVSLTNITIPDGVTSIGEEAFYNCVSLTNITISDSVTSIGKDAFSGTAYYKDESNWEDGMLYIGPALIVCDRARTGVVITDGTTCIADSAFSSSSFLIESITIPDSVISIGKGAFVGCDRLGSIAVAGDNKVYHATGNCLIETASKTLIAGCVGSVIPTDGSVTCIGEDAFHGRDRLTSITIPDNVTSIGNEAFSRCDSLTSITIPDSVTSIGRSAFSYCKSLTSITIPDSVTSIGSGAFSGTAYYKDDSNWEDGMLYIGHALICCNQEDILLMTTIKNGTICIADGAFSTSAPRLTNITIPASVTSIGERAFHYCKRLTSITIMRGVTSIGERALSGCENLTNITFTGTKAQWSKIEKGDSWKDYTGSFTVHCTDGDIPKDQA